MNTLADLCSEHFEPLQPKKTGSALVRLRHGRRNSEVESGVQGDRLIDDPQLALELFELTAHPFEAAPQRGVVAALGAVRQKLAQRSLDDRAFGLAVLLSGCFEPREKLFRELHTDFLFHG